MSEIIEASQLLAEDKVYLKKDFFGWRVVDPWKTPDGKINWFNFIFGGKRALIGLIVILVIVALLYFGINELIGQYKIIAANPCDFCKLDVHAVNLINLSSLG